MHGVGRFGNVMVGIVVELHVGQRGFSLSFRFLELFRRSLLYWSHIEGVFLWVQWMVRHELIVIAQVLKNS